MQEPAITEELIEAHGIKPEEYAEILTAFLKDIGHV